MMSGRSSVGRSRGPAGRPASIPWGGRHPRPATSLHRRRTGRSTAPIRCLTVRMRLGPGLTLQPVLARSPFPARIRSAHPGVARPPEPDRKHGRRHVPMTVATLDCRIPAPLSSRGLGRRPLTAETRVRIPVAVPAGTCDFSAHCPVRTSRTNRQRPPERTLSAHCDRLMCLPRAGGRPRGPDDDDPCITVSRLSNGTHARCGGSCGKTLAFGGGCFSDAAKTDQRWRSRLPRKSRERRP